MRKWIWVALLVLVAVGVVSGNKFVSPPSSPVPKIKVEKTIESPEIKNRVAPASEQPVYVPNVDSDKLFAHIKQLNFQRYTDSERDRTRTYLMQSLRSFGWEPKLEPFEGGVNIFAQRQGTEPQAGAILVAAHYDTVLQSPGADDNASGVAVVLELARLLGSRSTLQTLQLAFFDREELGLRGSLAFAANQAHLANLRGVIVMDMVGFACYTPGCQQYPDNLPIIPPTDKGDFLAVVGDAEHLPLLNAFQNSERVNLPSVLTLPVPFKGALMPDTLRSDHAPFWYVGVGAVLLTDTANLRSPHYHQSSDTPATIERAFFTGAAQIVVNTTTRLLENGDRLETQPSPSLESSNSVLGQ